VIYRVIGEEDEDSRRFLERLKERLKIEFDQEEVLIVQRDVDTL
jgi:hypothetical protein